MWPDFDTPSAFSFNLPHYALCLIGLELGRRFLLFAYVKCSGSAHAEDVLDDVVYDKDLRWLKATVMATCLYVGSGLLTPKVMESSGVDDSIDNPLSLLLTSGLVLTGYTVIHSFLVLSPRARREKLKHDLHNIGPGEAKSFASIIKVGLRNPERVGRALKDYMRKQKIGPENGNDSLDFMTSKLVFLFPANLVAFAEMFESTKKKTLKERKQEDSRPWVPTNSQGIVHFDKWARSLAGEEDRLNTAPELSVKYEMSGAKRDWVRNVISWVDKRNGKSPKTWYFLTFDNKPLEHILEWYNENKTSLSESEIQRQVELYRECLQRELDSDPACAGQYYFLDFKDKLSDSIVSLIKDIETREKRRLE